MKRILSLILIISLCSISTIKCLANNIISEDSYYSNQNFFNSGTANKNSVLSWIEEDLNRFRKIDRYKSVHNNLDSFENKKSKHDTEKNDIIDDSSFINKINQMVDDYAEKHHINLKRWYKMVGDGTRFIVFNCTEPSIINSNKQRIAIKNTQLNQNKDGLNTVINGNKAECDLPTNMWRDVKYHSLITYDLNKNEFNTAYNEYHIKQILNMNFDYDKLRKDNDDNVDDSDNNYGLVASILRTFHHPRFYY